MAYARWRACRRRRLWASWCRWPLRRPRLLPAAVGRPRVDDRADDGDGVAPLAAGDPGRYAALAAALAVVVGALCLLACCSAGFLADLLSKPVLVGYMAGIGVLMIAGQLGKTTGVPVPGDSPCRSWRRSCAGCAGCTGDRGLAAVVLVLLLFLPATASRRRCRPAGRSWCWPRWSPRFLAAGDGVRVVGDVPGLPRPGVPACRQHDSTRCFSRRGRPVVGVHGQRADRTGFRGPQRLAHRRQPGAARARRRERGDRLAQAFPVSSSGSRTVIGDAWAAAPSSTRSSPRGLVVVAARSAAACWRASRSPRSAPSSMYAAAPADRHPRVPADRPFRRSELVLALATTAAVLVFDILYGVLIAVGLSILDLLRRVARPHDGILGYVPASPACTTSTTTRRPERARPGGLPLRLPAVLRQRRGLPRRALAAVDRLARAASSGSCSMPRRTSRSTSRRWTPWRSCARSCTARHRLRHGPGQAGPARRAAAAGLVERIGEERIFPTLPTAVEAYRRVSG